MEKLHFSIIIGAPKKKVWDTMLDDATYRQWTSIFNPSGSYYEGKWTTGSSMRFLGPEKEGSVSGMISRIRESRPYDFLSIEHLGEIIKGKENLWPNNPNGAPQENYTFKDAGEGMTELLIDMDTTPEFTEMFKDMWPKALEKLKAMAEKSGA